MSEGLEALSRNPYVSWCWSSGIWDTLRSRAGVRLGAILCRGGCVSPLPARSRLRQHRPLGLGGSLRCPRAVSRLWLPLL